MLTTENVTDLGYYELLSSDKRVTLSYRQRHGHQVACSWFLVTGPGVDWLRSSCKPSGLRSRHSPSHTRNKERLLYTRCMCQVSWIQCA